MSIFGRLRIGFNAIFFYSNLQQTFNQQLALSNLQKYFCCHFVFFSLILTATAPQGAGANCFCSAITEKQKNKTTSEEQMKFNKWTLGLAAVGAISLTSAARADEAPKMSMLNTSLSDTTLSGFVDVGAQYNLGNYNDGPATGVPAGTFTGNVDNFSLNTIDIALDKPEDSTPWASGYHIELNLGQNAVGVGAGSQAALASPTGLALRQGYVVIRTPVGNGIDWKVGVQDDIIGYEGNTDGANPNYTRSIGYSIEPTTLLGMIGTYKINDIVSVTAGLADATSPGAFAATPTDKTLAGAVALTAPDSWGWIKGATMNMGALLNIDNGGTHNFYAGVTIPTPLSALKVGGAFDLVAANDEHPGNPHNDSGWVAGVYGAYQVTDKFSVNVRGEAYDLTGATSGFAQPGDGAGEELTGTVQYNLWANVISRMEIRWDNIDAGKGFNSHGATSDSILVAANLIYTF